MKLNNTNEKEMYLPPLAIYFPSNIHEHSNISIFNLVSVNVKTADIICGAYIHMYMWTYMGEQIVFIGDP